ncbi:hypothetical protein ACFVYP_29005 [Kitasatospora sp. NPDC058201]|uniref:hypothetical protein n=1 Tax=unclassified Kitasatospora TaxID=2633591 RepID=UPI00365D03E8
MSDPQTPTLVEVTAVPPVQPPAADPGVKTPPGAPSGAVPGVPLAVAVANALGGTVAGALALGGPVTLAVAGTAAGAAALGGLARRARTARHHTPNTALRRTADRHSGGPGGLFAPGPAPSAARRATAGSSPPPGVRSPGRAAGPSTAAGHPSAGLTSSAASRKGPSAMGRTAGTPSPTARRTAGTVRAARRDDRLAKVAERTARRVAKGQAKAERAAGIDPATGAGTAVARGGAAPLASGGVSPVQAKALRRSAMRHRTRMAGVAAATGLVGLASAAAFNWRHKGKVAGHMRRVWTRMAARARAVRAARDAAIHGTANPATNGPASGQLPVVPVPAQSVNIPGRPTPASAAARVAGVAGLFARPDLKVPGHTRTADPIALGKPTVKEPTTVSDQLGGTAATFSLSSAADILLQAATTFDPETMIEFQALADDLPVAFTTIQDVLRVLAEKGAQQLPLDPVVAEEIAEGYRAMGKVVQSLEEVGATFRKAHAEDLERHENPRNGIEAERKWNV